MHFNYFPIITKQSRNEKNGNVRERERMSRGAELALGGRDNG